MTPTAGKGTFLPYSVKLLFSGARRLFDGHARQRRIGLRDATEVLIDPGVQLLLIEIARDHERRVVWPVVSGVKCPHVFNRGGVQLLDVADTRPPVRMRRPGFLFG